MYARWVPPSAGGFTPSAPATNQSKANESSHNHNRNYHQHGNYNDYEAESQEPEEVMTQEQEQEEKPLSATNGFGYSRWTPGGATIAGATAPVVGKKALIRRRQVSESESSSSSESSSEESSSDEESDEEEAKVVKRKREEVVDGPEVKKVRVESESGDPSESEGASDNASSSDDSSDSESDSEVPVNRIPEPTTDAMDIDSPAPGEAKATKKPPKKEKGKKSPINPYSDSDLKEAPSKHKSTLDRKTKSLQLAATLPESATTAAPHSPDSDTEKHGLEPLPQPEVLEDLSTVVPSFETLPPWLAAPIRVSATNMADWKILCLSETPARILAGKGYKEAFAVQTAVIPLLTGSAREVQGDVLVQAATGSGKTMAYAVPVVRELSEGVVTRLRALVVLPTRELVRQAAEAFEICAGAFEGEGKRVRIGVAVGNQSLKYEQSVLVERRERFGGRESEDVDVEAEAEEEEERRRAEVGAEFMSRVDVLICTPGRLVDHLRHTPGFDLTYVRWLIVDEADKLLAQSFQGWLDLLTARLTATAGVFSARDHPGGALEGVRKVVLSATLTRDLSLLGGLGLRRPRLVVLEGGKGGEEGLQHVLPEGLTERVVRIRDAALKPLYLVDVLRRLARERMWKGKVEKAEEKKKEEVEAEDNSKSESESESNSSSDSDPVSDSDSDSDSDSSPATPHPPKLSTYLTPKTFRSTVLIFTKSNESALRLTHLLTLLLPSLTPLISTLTSSTPSSHRRRLLSSFTARTHRILVASDLVARGIDVPSLNHVINYDLPASLPGYVHRVGRTARAGRDGVAWTLLPDNESGWFWGRIAKAKDVGRANKVERIRVGDEQGELPEAEVARYEEALAELGWVARGRQ